MLKQHIDFLQMLLEKLGGDDDGPGASSSAGSAEAPKAETPKAAAWTEPEESHDQKMERLFSTVSCLGVCCLHMSCVN